MELLKVLTLEGWNAPDSSIRFLGHGVFSQDEVLPGARQVQSDVTAGTLRGKMVRYDVWDGLAQLLLDLVDIVSQIGWQQKAQARSGQVWLVQPVGIELIQSLLR